MVKLPFKDRLEAGRLLGNELAARQVFQNTIVLGLARGGVPVGAEVARILKAPLDTLVVRKLGVPWQPELAMGAVAGTTTVLDRQLIRDLGISSTMFEAVVMKEVREIERREKVYRDDSLPLRLSGLTVILVDDGLATGSTMVAAVRHVRSFHPEKAIVAVPVASREACHALSKEADGCICLMSPQKFVAVGQFYQDFRQVTDEEVRELIKQKQQIHAPSV